MLAGELNFCLVFSDIETPATLQVNQIPLESHIAVISSAWPL